MPNLRVITPTAIKPNDYFGQFTEGYDAGNKIRDRRGKRKKEDALSEYAGVLASTPEPITEAIPDVSALPSDDFDAPAAIPAGQPAGDDFGGAAAVGGGIPDAAVPVTRAKGPGKISAQQWDDYRKKLHDAAAKTKDATLISSVDDDLDKRLQKGFMRYGARARALMVSGNMEAAVDELQKAYNFFPNGADVTFQISKLKDGTPVILSEGRDEATGDARGSMVLTPDVLDKTMAFMQDPVKAAQYYQQDNRAERADVRAEKGAVRAEKAEDRAAAKFPIDQELKQLSVDLKKQNVDKAEYDSRMRTKYGEGNARREAERAKYSALSAEYKAIIDRDNAEWTLAYGKEAKTAKLDLTKTKLGKGLSDAVVAGLKAKEATTGEVLTPETRAKEVKRIEKQYSRVTDSIVKLYSSGNIPYDTDSNIMMKWTDMAYKMIADPAVQKLGMTPDEIVMRTYEILRNQGKLGGVAAPLENTPSNTPGNTPGGGIPVPAVTGLEAGS